MSRPLYVSFRLEPDLVADLDKIAKAKFSDRSKIIRALVHGFVQSNRGNEKSPEAA